MQYVSHLTYSLIEKMLESLDKPNPEIEKESIVESEARYDAYNEGAVIDYHVNPINKYG